MLLQHRLLQYQCHTGGKRGGTCHNGIPAASHQHLLSLCHGLDRDLTWW
jgi:hypothetical protein